MHKRIFWSRALSWHSRVRPGSAPPRAPRLLAAVVYLGCVPIVGLLAVGAEFLALTIVDETRIRFPWFVALMNIIPALLTGFLVVAAVARTLKERQVLTVGLWDHLLRASPLYAVALLFGAWLVVGFTSGGPGFGLFAQAILWPWLAVIGGIVADACFAR